MPSWWARLVRWLRALVSPRRALPAGPSAMWEQYARSLPADVRAELAALPADRGAVRSIVAAAVTDYAHLRDVLLGPGASSSPVDDAALLAEAELTLRALVTRAPSVAALVAIAVERKHDRAGREAAGEALLGLQDQARALHDAASAALCWAATPTAATAAALGACVAALQRTSRAS